MLDPENQNLIMNAWAEAARSFQGVAHSLEGVATDMAAPHVILRARVYQDGDQWCCLYGENIQEGVCAFGSSPRKACAEFDRIWNGKPSKDKEQRCAAQASLQTSLSYIEKARQVSGSCTETDIALNRAEIAIKDALRQIDTLGR